MQKFQKIQISNQTEVPLPFQIVEIEELVHTIEKDQNCHFNFIDINYVDENEIIRLNNEFLQHNYVTDIITFRYDEPNDINAIECSLACCAPQIVEQAKEYNQTVKSEFLRIIIHGLMHLIGYNDQTDTEKVKMKEMEDYFLSKCKLD